MSILVVPLPGAEPLATELAGPLGAQAGSIDSRRFPDGESYLRLQFDPAGHDIVVAAALRDPDAQALSLWFVADTARELGARSVGLATPYLPYMRQDARFKPGEAITSRSFGRYVSQAFDWLATVDPHLHRYDSLDAVYSIRTAVVPSAPAVARWVQAHVPEAVLVGPDSESEQWVADVARRVGCPWQVLTKTRRGDRDVEVTLPDPDLVRGRRPVLLDDIISSGHTMAEAARHVLAVTGQPPTCIGVHALFDAGARQHLLDSGAGQVVTCNTVRDPSNAVDVVPDLAAAIRGLLG